MAKLNRANFKFKKGDVVRVLPEHQNEYGFAFKEAYMLTEIYDTGREAWIFTKLDGTTPVKSGKYFMFVEQIELDPFMTACRKAQDE